jgi:hypothetical protein
MILVFAAAPASPQPAEPAAVEGVEITARRAVVGTLQQGVQAYRPEFFTPARPSTAMDMIQWLPGFNFEETRDVRGLAGALGNVLIDGKPPTSKTDTLSTVLKRIPSNQVERVDIIVGGAPGIDMRGRPVIANVIMKKTAAPQGSIALSNSFFQNGRISPELLVTANRNKDGRSFEASLTLNQRIVDYPGRTGQGVWTRVDDKGQALFRADETSRTDNPSQIVTGAYEFPFAKGRLKLNGSLRAFQAKLDDLTLLRGTGERYILDGADHYTQGELGLRYERSLGPRTTLEAQALQRATGHDQDFVTHRPPIDSDFTEKDDQAESVLRATLRFKRDSKLVLEGSAEGAFNSVDTTSRLLNSGVLDPLPGSDVRVEERRGEFGALTTWTPGPKFSLTGALKLESSTLTASRGVDFERTLSFLKPRLTVAWSPDKTTQLRLRAEHEVGQIDMMIFTSNSEFNSGTIRNGVGGADIRPQRAWVAEAVLERQFWTGASLVLTARQKSLIDVVEVRFVAPGAVGSANIGDGRQTDLSATLTLPLKRLGLNGAMIKGVFTQSWTQVTDPTNGLHRRRSGLATPLAELHFTYDLPRRKLNWGFDYLYYGPFALYRPAGAERAAGWTRLSAFVEYRYRPNLSFRLEGFNLNDARPLQRVEYYSGVRGLSPLLYADERRIGLKPYLFVRARRTFN